MGAGSFMNITMMPRLSLMRGPSGSGGIGSMTELLFEIDSPRYQHLSEIFVQAPHRFSSKVASAALPLYSLQELIPENQWDVLPNELTQWVPKRRLSFIAGRLCAEKALQQLGLYTYVSRGLTGEPIWPSKVTGSITHTDEMAYAVVAPSISPFGIGIDSESCVNDEGFRDISQICCTQYERTTHFSGRQNEHIATLIFSAKESLFKSIHHVVQRIVEFDEVEVLLIDWERERFCIAPKVDGPLESLFPPVWGNFSMSCNVIHTSIHLGC